MSKLENTAFIFPGQGSQSLGMLAEFSQQYPIINETFSEASDALGYDLWQVSQNDEEKLNQTHITQPAILTASVALWRLCQSLKPFEVSYMAGHSLGEYSALVCSEVLKLSDAVKLVEQRGQFMQAAVPAGQGAMAAILGLDDQQVKDACAQAAEGQVASAVNFNSPGQVVIAGNKEAIDRAMVLCKEGGARKAMPLAVSVPSHCALMAPAAEELKIALAALTIESPKCAVVNNVDVSVEGSADAIQSALVRQLTDAVRWVESVQFMAAHGVENLVECGPGKVLTGLGKRIDKALNHSALNTPDALSAFIESV